MNKNSLNVLVIGCGNMGTSHAIAFSKMDGFRICGIVSRGESKHRLNAQLGGNYPVFDDVDEALRTTNPQAVCISTYPDTHYDIAMQSLNHGCHVFVEKPLAHAVDKAQELVAKAISLNKKLMVGYILRHHPSWKRFIEISGELGKPLVMRMNLNQQSHGATWKTHLNLMKSMSPIVDCGVHYLDVMCQMTRSKPAKVHAIGARLTSEIADWNYNYGQLQIQFEDGSVGWYEAGWGPMMSETAYFVKDVIGPNGSVSMVPRNLGKSDSVEGHTKTESLLWHKSQLNSAGNFEYEDEWIDMESEPGHQELCNMQQEYFLRAIREDLDLQQHMQDAVMSLRIAFACDESVKTGRVVTL